MISFGERRGGGGSIPSLKQQKKKKEGAPEGVGGTGALIGVAGTTSLPCSTRRAKNRGRRRTGWMPRVRDQPCLLHRHTIGRRAGTNGVVPSPPSISEPWRNPSFGALDALDTASSFKVHPSPTKKCWRNGDGANKRTIKKEEDDVSSVCVDREEKRWLTLYIAPCL